MGDVMPKYHLLPTTQDRRGGECNRWPFCRSLILVFGEKCCVTERWLVEHPLTHGLAILTLARSVSKPASPVLPARAYHYYLRRMRIAKPLPSEIEEAIRYWHRLSRSDQAIADVLTELTGCEWNRWKVQYYRGRLGLPNNGYHDHGYGPGTDMLSTRAYIRRAFAARHGWGHLLPYQDKETGEHVPGHELSKTEVRVLNALSEHGPQTAGQLARRLGRARRVTTHGVSVFTRMRLVGLIQFAAAQGRVAVYQLGPGIGKHTRLRRPDGTDLRVRGATYRDRPLSVAEE